MALHHKNLTPRNIKILALEYRIIVKQVSVRIHRSLHEKCIVKGIPVKQTESSDFHKLFMAFLADVRKLEGLCTEQYYLQQEDLLFMFFKLNLCIISYTNACKHPSVCVFSKVHC